LHDRRGGARRGAQEVPRLARPQPARRHLARLHQAARLVAGARLPAGAMRRRSGSSVVANPVLVGAVTTLVAVVAVFLSYNANNGLPFVPTRELKVLVSNGANLLPGNEVREGGQRIGVVSDMRPVGLPDGTTGAEATLHIDDKVPALPVDSTVNLRPRS